MLIQLLVNGIVTGCLYALIAMGFGLIYSTTRIFHFAHGAVYALSAYLFYTFYVSLGLHVSLAIPLTVGVAVMVGVLINELVYQPLTESGSSSLVTLLSSIGVYTVIINCIAIFYGSDTKILHPQAEPVYVIGSILLTRIQVLTVVIFALLFSSSIIVLHKTYVGIAIRAMRDDSALVSALGINPHMVQLIVFAGGSALAASSSILLAFDVGIELNIGLTAVLSGAVAAIIGGVSFFEGAVVGALLLALLQSLLIYKASSKWVDAVTFVVLICFLLFRPEGIFGRTRRVDEVPL
jgi:branched-chain amino acid transport system permease protein